MLVIKSQVAGMVMLYNSSEAIIANIRTYLPQISKLFVIDNSDIPNTKLIDLFHDDPSIEYYSMGGNKGVAFALNMGAQLARNEGYTHLLTMDDDSKAPEDLIDTMLAFLQTYKGGEIGIISASHNNNNKIQRYKIVAYTMTSGNLIDLDIHKKIGGFWEELFIDHVDHEYGLRLNKAGYQIIELLGLILNHSLGETKPLSVWSGRNYFISHRPIRMYYIARNGWIVAKKYPSFRWIAVKLILKEWIKALFWEDARRERISYLIKGVKDARNGRMGQLTLTESL